MCTPLPGTSVTHYEPHTIDWRAIRFYEELDHVTRGLTDGLEVMAALFMASKDKISFDSCNREGGTRRD